MRHIKLSIALKRATSLWCLQVEIDERVIQMSKRFFPHFSAAFTDQRHKLVVGDAVRWVEDHAHEMTLDCTVS